jgi:hypothetical protein
MPKPTDVTLNGYSLCSPEWETHKEKLREEAENSAQWVWKEVHNQRVRVKIYPSLRDLFLKNQGEQTIELFGQKD